MFILEVAPLIAIPRNQTQILSYFNSQSLPAGSLVEVPVRGRNLGAIVLSSQPISSLKIKLKKEVDFELRPISKVVSSKPVITNHQLNTALWLSGYYFAPLGQCLKTVLPNFFGKKKYPPEDLGSETSPLYDLVGRTVGVGFLKTENFQKHYNLYENLLAQNKSKQILLLVPELTHLQYFADHYKNLDPLVLHSGSKIKDHYEIYKKAASGQPIFIIGTRIAAFLPFKNLGLIILDDESNIAYRSDMTPKYGTPELARFLSKEYEGRLVINDLVPRLETFHELKLSTVSIERQKDISFVNMVSEIKSANFSVFSRDLREKIIEAAKNKGKTAIFLPRKGYASLLVCRSCYQTVRCKNCDLSMAIHKLSGGKILKCRKCRNQEKVPDLCPSCKNGLLEFRGLGVEKASEKIKKLFKDRGVEPPKIFEFTSDLAQNRKQEEKIISEFQKTKPAILVTTQKIFSYKYLLKPDLMGILNLDSLSAFPDFRTDEITLKSIALLAGMSSQTIIQGYRPENKALRAILENNYAGFFKEELSDRKTFSYPPFSKLIRLSYAHREKTRVIFEAKVLSQKIKMFDAKTNSPDLEVVKEKGIYIANLVLKTNSKVKERNDLLRLVPSKGWKIEIDSPSTWRS